MDKTAFASCTMAKCLASPVKRVYNFSLPMRTDWFFFLPIGDQDRFAHLFCCIPQIRYAGGDERCGRRRVGLLNPLSGETHKQGMCLDRWTKQKISNRKKRFARKCRRRTRPERRRIAKTSQNVSRARSRTGELNIATWNVRSLSLTGRRGAGHAEVLLQECKVLGCDVIGLQETRRPGRTEFATAGYRVFCSGVDGSTGRAGQHGVGLAVKESIIREATWTQELTNERLMSMTFNLTGKSNAVTFIVAYG